MSDVRLRRLGLVCAILGPICVVIGTVVLVTQGDPWKAVPGILGGAVACVYGIVAVRDNVRARKAKSD